MPDHPVTRSVRPGAPALLRGRGGGEPVADPGDGEDEERPAGGVLDLAPKVAYMDVDDAGLDRVLVAPDMVEDLLAREHLARIAGKERQQVELRVGQLDLV